MLRYPTAPLSYCSVILLLRYPTAPLSYRSVIIPLRYHTAPLSYCSNAASLPHSSKSPRRRKRSASPLGGQKGAPPASPRSCKLHVGRLTRNVTREHIVEIFSVYGAVRGVDAPTDRGHPEFTRGFAYVEYENADDATKAIKHMDGGTRADTRCQSLTRVLPS